MSEARRAYVQALRTLGYGMVASVLLLVALGPHTADLPWAFLP